MIDGWFIQPETMLNVSYLRFETDIFSSYYKKKSCYNPRGKKSMSHNEYSSMPLEFVNGFYRKTWGSPL